MARDGNENLSNITEQPTSMTRPTIHQQIHWVYTTDLETSADFYANSLGLELAVDEGSAKIFKTAEAALVGVCQVFGDRVVAPEGSMLTFVTDEVDAWYARMLETGADVEGEPHVLPQFDIYACFVRDPNGYRIEFQQFLA